MLICVCVVCGCAWVITCARVCVCVRVQMVIGIVVT